MRVSEVFRSWQGEYPAGVLMLFVRLQGCNRRCPWCDTKYAQDPEGGKEMHWRAILEICRAWDGPVCFTGGEPMLQLEELRKVVRRLRQPVYIETNGDIDPGRLRATLIVSPKDWKVARYWVRREVVLKFVVDIETEWQDFVMQYEQLPRGKALCMVMPLTRPEDGREVVASKCKRLVELIRDTGLNIGYVCRDQLIYGYR